jgi:hypothetical protein
LAGRAAATTTTTTAEVPTKVKSRVKFRSSFTCLKI